MPDLRSSHHVWVLLIAGHISLAGLLYGLDTGSIGPITEMIQFERSIGRLSSSQQGIYVACILLSAALSSLASGYVSDRISRKYGIFLGSILTAVGATLSAASPNFASLIVARLVTGVGSGQAISVGTVYLVEVAPVEIRGVAACLLQLYVTIGITAGYFTAFGSRNLAGSIAWRTPFILQAAIALLLAAGMVFVPFSPRWLMQREKRTAAEVVLQRLRKDEDQVVQELADIDRSRVNSQRTDDSTFGEIFSRRYVKRTTVGIVILSLQQLTGIDAVLYYAPILFQQAGLTSDRASFLASGVTGIVLIAFTLPAQIWVDNWGRKKPLIIGGTAMTICLLLIGSLYARYGQIVPHAINNNNDPSSPSGVLLTSKPAQWTVIVLVYIFAANFSWSWAVVGKIYACEIIPTRLRAKVCAVEQLANWLVNFVVALTAPVFLRRSPSGPYFLYGVATLLAVGLCCWIPETKGRSLEEVEGLWEKKTTEVAVEGEGEVSGLGEMRDGGREVGEVVPMDGAQTGKSEQDTISCDQA